MAFELLDEGAAAVFEGAEGNLGRNGGEELVIVPRAGGFGWCLHLEQVHVVDVPAIGAQLAFTEDRWFQHKLLGLELPEPWRSVEPSEVHEWSFHSADADPRVELLALYEAACERSRAATASCPSMDALAVSASFGKKRVNLRWLLAHMIDETARHSGHADLIRDALGRPPVR